VWEGLGRDRQAVNEPRQVGRSTLARTLVRYCKMWGLLGHAARP
jgi:hypothetical protein